jgi:hypothetical protein
LNASCFLGPGADYFLPEGRFGPGCACPYRLAWTSPEAGSLWMEAEIKNPAAGYFVLRTAADALILSNLKALE